MDHCSTQKKDDIYWKAFIGFVSPKKQIPKPVIRQRSFEYMELSHESTQQSPHSNSHSDYDAIKADYLTAEIVEAKSSESCLVQTDIRSLLGDCVLNEDADHVSENNNNNLQAPETCGCQSINNYEKLEREGHILSTSSCEDGDEFKNSDKPLKDIPVEQLTRDSPFGELIEHTAESSNTNAVSPTIFQQPFVEEDSFDGPELPQFVPTLSVIAEEDEETSPCRTFGVDLHPHKSNNHFDEHLALDDCDVTSTDDVMSTRSFVSSLRRSSTIENLDEEGGDELLWQPHDFGIHTLPEKGESKCMSYGHDDESSLPRCSSIETKEDEDCEEAKRQETSLSNHSSLVDSAYSSHEKLNVLSRSTPDLCDSIEDLQYIPVSYADSSLKRKKRRWPTFRLGDSRESLNAKVSGSSKFGSLKRRITRKLSRKGQRPKQDFSNQDNSKDDYPSSTLPRRTSFRRTIMRVLRFRTSDAVNRYPGESRPRSWSLPTRNRHTTAIVMETEDSDVVVSELAVI